VEFDDSASPTATGRFPLGVTPVVLEVSLEGDIGRDTVLVTVRDSAPPTLSLSVEPSMLWPPNHKFVPAHVTATAIDACDGTPVVRLVSVECSDPDTDPHSGDVADGAFGEADFDVQLRAERRGDGTGRVYTLTYEAADASGHTVRKSVGVVVPHSMGHAQLVTDERPLLTIFGGPGAQVSKVDPASIVVGTWDTDWLRAASTEAVEADVDHDGHPDRTWTMEPITDGSGWGSGETVYARWRSDQTGWSTVLSAGPMTAVDSRVARFSIRPSSNPARGRARLEFELPSQGWARLRIFDLGGRVLATLADGVMTAGLHQAVFETGRDASAQMVFYQLDWMGRRLDGRMVLIR
jgi:hypothetical protein